MIKRILATTVALTIGLLSFIPTPVVAKSTNSEAYIPSATSILLITKELQTAVREYAAQVESAQIMIDAAEDLEYEPDHPILLAAKEEYNLAKDNYDYYKARLDQEKDKWEEKQDEYGAATDIWIYLKDLGYSDYVCAGIMGNLMSEVGGQTLDIQYWLTSTDGYFGMCQWSKGYNEVWGADLAGQCDFLRDTIEYEFNTYGYKYKKGFDYAQFLELESAEEAAYAFAKCYERCGVNFQKIRKTNATKAYEYFVN